MFTEMIPIQTWNFSPIILCTNASSSFIVVLTNPENRSKMSDLFLLWKDILVFLENVHKDQIKKNKEDVQVYLKKRNNHHITRKFTILMSYLSLFLFPAYFAKPVKLYLK